MKKILLLVALLALVSSRSWSADAPITSQFSSIKKCKSIATDERSEILECKSTTKHNVFIEVMDMYSGLLIQDKRTKYNVVEMINEVPAGKCTVGAFTYISGDTVEWLYRKKELIGLAVQVSGTDILSDDQKEVSSLCVIKIDKRQHSTILGLASSQKEAVKLLKHNL